MHNFAQRRSFMMGGTGYDDTDYQQEEIEPHNRVYRVDDEKPIQLEYDEYQMEAALNGGMSENEYRQSPGRSRNLVVYDDADTRERPVPIDVKGRLGAMSPSDYGNHHHHGKSSDPPIYSIHGRYDSYVETSALDGHQKATIPVFNRMKRPEENVFTFDDLNDDVHTVPGIINRHEERHTADARESMSVAPAEKKVFYFDIDDLSQRLLNNGDQDLNRRLRKKKEKNARNRIGRTRSRRKSKKSVFNLELDTAATHMLHGNDDTVVTEPVQFSNEGQGQLETRSLAGGDTRRALYVDTGNNETQFPRSSRSVSSPREEGEKNLRRNPSVGSPPAEERTAGLSPNSTMDYEDNSFPQPQLSMSNAGSPRDSESVVGRSESQTSSPRRSRRERPSPSDQMVQNRRSNKATSSAPSPSGGIRSPKSAEAAKVYDDISDRLDHIVRREDNVENRQKAIRAVFEDVQQHVAELKRHKQQAVTKDLVDTNEKRADQSDDQLKQDANEDAEISKQLTTSPKGSDSKSCQIKSEMGHDIPESTQNSSEDKPEISEALSETPEAMSGVSNDNENGDPQEELGQDNLDDKVLDASKSQLSRPSAYLSSDNSCDDDMYVQTGPNGVGNDSIYVIDKDDIKSNFHEQRRVQSFENQVTSGQDVAATKNDDTVATQPKPTIDPTSDANKAATVDDKIETEEGAKEIDNSDDGGGGDNGSLEGLASRTVEEARKRAIRGEDIAENVLETDPEDEGLDIDKEFERVVPHDDDNESPNVDYNIDETLDRVARQNELEKQNKAEKNECQKDKAKVEAEKSHRTKKSMSRMEEEAAANALLDGIAQSNIFSDNKEPQSPTSQHSQRSQQSRLTVKSDTSSHAQESVKKNPKQVKSQDDDDDDDDAVVSMDYDHNFALSASKSSASASDLEKFPAAPEKDYEQEYEQEQEQDYEQDYQEDQYESDDSSVVSSDISESTSEDSMSSESSYDSFISIVETEEESDLEFFDKQEGFAENFMSNLVSSTFGWIEKKQEQLVCGFKSGEFDGPSLLRQSMTRKKAEEVEAEREKRDKAMNSLHNAVASKYGREGNALPMSTTTSEAADKKAKSSSHKKDHKRSETSNRKKAPRDEVKHSSKEGTLSNANSPSGSKGHKKTPADDRTHQKHVVNSRKTSLVDSKSSESERSNEVVSPKAQGERKKPRKSKKSSENQTEERKSEAKLTKKSVATPVSPVTDTSETVGQQYNFDFLSSDEDEAGPSSVKVIDVKTLGKEDKKIRSPKIKDRKNEVQKPSPQNTEAKHQVSATIDVEDDDEPEIVDVEEDVDADTTAAARSKTHRTSCKPLPSSREAASPVSVKSGISSMSQKEAKPTSSRRDRAKSPPVSPRRDRDRSPRPADLGPNDVVTIGKPSKKVSSRKSNPSSKVSSSKDGPKTSKKSSKKEKSSSRSSKLSKSESKRSSRRRASNSRGRAVPPTLEEKRDESESDENSLNMTEEERELARKERRRAAALKRRRKLRERRRAKLEQTLTDDTFG